MGGRRVRWRPPVPVALIASPCGESRSIFLSRTERGRLRRGRRGVFTQGPANSFFTAWAPFMTNFMGSRSLTWELCCFSLPSIVPTAISHNQHCLLLSSTVGQIVLGTAA